MPTVQNAKKVNAELQRLGFGNLKDPTLPDQFAACVRDHAHFRGILMHIPQGLERAKWYEAMAPKVRFKAKPLADYEIESRTLADQNQLPAYNPETLELREYKPAEFSTRYTNVICELCEADIAVTLDGKWHYYGTPEQCVCATSRFAPAGYPIARNRPVPVPELHPDCTCLSLVKPRSENPCPVHDPYEYEAWQVEQKRYPKEQPSKLERLASDAIDRDLREASARYELSLVCRVCTYEQKFRVKNKPTAYKIARREGWLIEYKSATALCRACKPKLPIQ